MPQETLLQDLARQGFSRPIIEAFRRVRREDFVRDQERDLAYENIALPLGYGQTISQPSTVAFMLTILEMAPGLKTLEVGSGSGYVLALLNALNPGGDIYGVEIVPALWERSEKILKEFDNIKIFPAEKSLGLADFAPFDRILVSAAATRLPEELVRQLAESGVMVVPINEEIAKIRKTKNGLLWSVFPGFSFVPLIE